MVKPEGEDGATEEDEKRSEGEEFRQHFCASALVITSSAEGTGILVSCAFWILVNASPGEPGTKMIPLRQSLLNIEIMLVGDLIVTDGTIAYMGWPSNMYNNDPAKEWSVYKKRKVLVVGVALIVSTGSAAAVATYASQFCYTSLMSAKSE